MKKTPASIRFEVTPDEYLAIAGHCRSAKQPIAAWVRESALQRLDLQPATRESGFGSSVGADPNEARKAGLETKKARKDVKK